MAMCPFPLIYHPIPGGALLSIVQFDMDSAKNVHLWMKENSGHCGSRVKKTRSKQILIYRIIKLYIIFSSILLDLWRCFRAMIDILSHLLCLSTPQTNIIAFANSVDPDLILSNTIFATMDVSKFNSERVHFRNTGVKWSTHCNTGTMSDSDDHSPVEEIGLFGWNISYSDFHLTCNKRCIQGQSLEGWNETTCLYDSFPDYKKKLYWVKTSYTYMYADVKCFII